MNRYNVWKAEEYTYPAAFGFQPNLRSYLHEDDKVRPCVLVIPGGGYCSVSPTEGEIVAKKFYEMEYQTFVGTYTTNLLGTAPLKMQPINDLSRMVRYIRKHASEFRINAEQLVICGFSAGAHLCGSLSVHWMDVKDINPEYAEISNKPTGTILSYPVITSGEFANRGSFDALLGAEASEEELAYMSLEKQVSEQTPPIFMWHTVTDEAVPIENSYLMAMALRAAGVPFEHHVFPKGAHGLSLSDEVWESGQFGELYTLEQLIGVVDAIKAGGICVPEEIQPVVAMFTHPSDNPFAGMGTNKAVKEVAVWPELADAWMKENVFI